MDNKLIVSSSPHISSPVKTKTLMIDVIIALMPAFIASIILFGVRSIIIVCATVAAAVVAEYICRKVMKRPNTITDFSAIVTGLLLAFNLPATVPIWMAVLGAVIAIVVVKQMFGGIGNNFVNPALAARIILMTSFPTAMTSWTAPFDGTATATPLAIAAGGNASELPSYLDMFLGKTGGCIGETCALALLIGGIYLVIRKVISPSIPLVYIDVVFVFSAALGQDPVMQILSGGLFIGAIFMATDYVTSPLTNKGKVIYAIGCGILTVLIRSFGSLPEGVSFSIIIMNILVPHIEKLTTPKPFGAQKEAAK